MSARHSNYLRLEKRQAVIADERQDSPNPVKILTRVTHHSQNKPDESRPGRPNFREDFLLEHSRFGQQADSIEVPGCF